VPIGRPDTFASLWAAIADIGRDPLTGGYRRFGLTDVDRKLRTWFAAECGSRGLELSEDAMGNQWAWWGDPDAVPGTGVATGSHLDSVPDGGAFDGPLGVVSALAAVDRLRAAGFVPARPIGVVSFGEEEGARFGVGCAGSRVITGELAADRALALVDADGITMAEALQAAGRPVARPGRDDQALARIGCFVELHIEQGRGLADEGRSIGVGDRIWPHGRWRLDFPGEANHAGTTRLEDRHDAAIGCARAVLAARSAAQANRCLATVGRIEVRPGAVNGIASSATAWLDARGADEEAVRAVVAEVTAVAAEHDGSVREESWTPGTAFDPNLVSRLAGLLGGAPTIGTGAGHDAGILAAAGIPAAMIFVRNPSGISHSPAEWAEPDDCLAGVGALVTVLADLAGEK
jgi:N-carbamoyl-L-amino-acid hydrolase